jgi:multiple antibiotic resistance protein
MPVDGLNYLVSATVTLVVVVDPVGLSPTFVAVTHGLPAKSRRQVALRASLIAWAILTGTAIGGDWLLRQLAIGLPAFRIAGGLLLFAIAAEMVLGVRLQRESKAAEQAVEEHVRNIAAFPLAIPLMAGPGAITATVLLSGQTAQEPVYLAALIGVIAAVCAVCFLVYLFATRIARYLGITGNVVLSRLLGVLLAALAVQYVVDGVRAVLGA